MKGSEGERRSLVQPQTLLQTTALSPSQHRRVLPASPLVGPALPVLPGHGHSPGRLDGQLGVAPLLPRDVRQRPQHVDGLKEKKEKWKSHTHKNLSDLDHCHKTQTPEVGVGSPVWALVSTTCTPGTALGSHTDQRCSFGDPATGRQTALPSPSLALPTPFLGARCFPVFGIISGASAVTKKVNGLGAMAVCETKVADSHSPPGAHSWLLSTHGA